MTETEEGIFTIETEITEYNESDGFKFVFNRDADDWTDFRFGWALNGIWRGGMDRKCNELHDQPGKYRITVNTKLWTYEFVKLDQES